MAAGTVDCYRLTVVRDAVRLRVLSETSNSLSGNLEMIDPSGKSACFRCIGQSALDCTAGPDSTYTIMVSDYDNKFHGLPDLGRKGCRRGTHITMAAETVDCYADRRGRGRAPPTRPVRNQ